MNGEEETLIDAEKSAEDEILNDANEGVDEASDNENERDENDQEENPYGEPKKFHVPIVIIAFLLLVVVLDLVCMIRFPKVVSDYKIYKLAEKRIEQGGTSAAIGDLYNMAEKHPDSTPIMVKLVDLSMENGYYDTAGYIINEYLNGKSLDDEEYNKIDSYYPKLESYFATYDAIEKIFNTASGQDTLDASYNDGIVSELNILLGQADMDYAYVYYWIGLIETDKTKGLESLQNSYDLDPECQDIRVQLSIMNRRLGNLEKARLYGEEAFHKDKLDVGALRAMSTLALVEGDLEKGLQYAEDAYKIYAEGTYIRDTYIVALYANDRNEDVKAIQDEMTELGQTLDDDTISYLNGEMTLEEYYIGE